MQVKFGDYQKRQAAAQRVPNYRTERFIAGWHFNEMRISRDIVLAHDERARQSIYKWLGYATNVSVTYLSTNDVHRTGGEEFGSQMMDEIGDEIYELRVS
jgi:hypothetical protein